jgi:hypothetical protein
MINQKTTNMKKTFLLTLALGLAGASSLVAGTVQVYITGSTAFRANVYTACTKLFSNTPPVSIYYADANHGGANSGFSSKTASWVMSGTPIPTLTTIKGNTLIVHGLFTGSIQGLKTTEQSTPLVWASPVGTLNGNATAYETNSPTVGFSDSSGSSAPYPASGNFVEENVCVQPFVMVKSTASGGVTNINNISWEQYRYGIVQGRIPLSAWTGNTGDTNNFIYLYERTADSGTRRTETSQMGYEYTDPVGVYIYDMTNNFWYTPTALSNSFAGFAPYGVIGTEGPGLNNANISSEFGYGYIGGGDIATALGNGNIANQGIGYLSIGDAKSITGSPWSQVVSFNGFWPTAAGIGIRGNAGTNDFSPITLGYYPCWGVEVLVHPIDPSQISDQKITETQLGDQFTSGSFMGVFNAQTLINGGSPITGSIENEIIISQPTGATAVTLAAMANSRQAVGGTIFPPFK